MGSIKLHCIFYTVLNKTVKLRTYRLKKIIGTFISFLVIEFYDKVA